ncbi:MAG TPA: (Fe-S)-binding protein [Bacillota bacterium]|jgi:hypothetical protein
MEVEKGREKDQKDRDGVRERDRALDAHWTPPGKDCGLCGARNCEEFRGLLATGERAVDDCAFYEAQAPVADISTVCATDTTDVLGNAWDFVLGPLPGEPSARKVVLPFRGDLVEKWGITRGDIVLGRPFGAGCPVQHVLKVIEADPVTGVLETWCVGPAFARGRPVKDVGGYHMLGFVGMATRQRRAPMFGVRHTFLPGFCMMHLNHTGLVNMMLRKEAGLQVRLEDIRILAGVPG